MAKLARALDIRNLHQATLLVSSSGTISQISTSFCEITGWSEADLLGQNVSVLVCPKIIGKVKHDRLVKLFKMNSESRIVGKPRILPVKTSNDEDIFLDVQLLPLGKESDFIYLCFFGNPEYPFTENEVSLEEDIVKTLIFIGPEDDLRQNTQDNMKLVTFCSLWVSKEIYLLIKFIKDNHHLVEAWKYLEDLAIYQKMGKLTNLYDLLVKHNNQPLIAFVNLIFLRIIFPQLCGEGAELKDRVVQFCKVVFSNLSDQTNRKSVSMDQQPEPKSAYPKKRRKSFALLEGLRSVSEDQIREEPPVLSPSSSFITSRRKSVSGIQREASNRLPRSNSNKTLNLIKQTEIAS
eukprot:TRINITY_DN5845_c0_g1_i1.p1 TRINITY_DN5845_c0_g1~~TRINITY_DN5845_c0_g1_i1.p1  ORF type:complete len:368 (-),score=92.96 TRINITY_DN5845_c0_g1_i1:40-1086(-)